MNAEFFCYNDLKMQVKKGLIGQNKNLSEIVSRDSFGQMSK